MGLKKAEHNEKLIISPSSQLLQPIAKQGNKKSFTYQPGNISNWFNITESSCCKNYFGSALSNVAKAAELAVAKELG